jgi:hypothetical protein
VVLLGSSAYAHDGGNYVDFSDINGQLDISETTYYQIEAVYDVSTTGYSRRLGVETNRAETPSEKYGHCIILRII